MKMNIKTRSTVLTKSIAKIASTVLGATIVDSADQAELVIVDDIRALGSNFDASKFYGIMVMGSEKLANLPANARQLSPISLLKDLTVYMAEIQPSPATIPTVVEEKVSNTTGLKVLVVDDTMANRQSAQEQLGDEYQLTIASGFDEAMEALGKETFDVALLDLHLPMSAKTLSNEAFHLGELVPYGLLLMLEAGHCGAKHIAIVTDLNHHADAFSAAFDLFRGKEILLGQGKVKLMHAPMKDGVKDWAKALEDLLS